MNVIVNDEQLDVCCEAHADAAFNPGYWKALDRSAKEWRREGMRAALAVLPDPQPGSMPDREELAKALYNGRWERDEPYVLWHGIGQQRQDNFRRMADVALDRLRQHAGTDTAEVERLRAELRLERSRLAAIGVVARGGDVRGVHPDCASDALEAVVGLLGCHNALKAELEECRAELMQERVRLAGCGAAAKGYGGGVKPGDYGWSDSISHVLEMYESYTQLRGQHEALRAGVASVCQRWTSQSNWHGGILDELRAVLNPATPQAQREPLQHPPHETAMVEAGDRLATKADEADVTLLTMDVTTVWNAFRFFLQEVQQGPEEHYQDRLGVAAQKTLQRFEELASGKAAPAPETARRAQGDVALPWPQGAR